MNPILTEALVASHQADLRHSARNSRRVRAARPPQPVAPGSAETRR
jgi:hypothetical protein